MMSHDAAADLVAQLGTRHWRPVSSLCATRLRGGASCQVVLETYAGPGEDFFLLVESYSGHVARSRLFTCGLQARQAYNATRARVDPRERSRDVASQFLVTEYANGRPVGSVPGVFVLASFPDGVPDVVISGPYDQDDAERVARSANRMVAVYSPFSQTTYHVGRMPS